MKAAEILQVIDECTFSDCATCRSGRVWMFLGGMVMLTIATIALAGIALGGWPVSMIVGMMIGSGYRRLWRYIIAALRAKRLERDQRLAETLAAQQAGLDPAQ